MRPVGDASLAVVYKQLASLLESGIAINEALRLILRHARGRLAQALAAVRAAVDQGAQLGEALAVDPTVFPASVRALVTAGETSGGLPGVFAELAASIEFRLVTRRRLLRGCLYPFVLFTLSFFLLPLSKLITGGVGAYLRASLLPYALALVVLAALLVLLPWGLRALLGPRRVARFSRRMPVVGGLLVARGRAVFARHLAAALRAGLDAFTSLRLASRATGDPDFAEKIDGASQRVRDGATLEEALARTGLFDDEMLLAVAGGEASGRLDASLEQQARLIQDALLFRLEVVVQLASVAVLLAVYAFVAWSVYVEYKQILGGTQEQLDNLMNGIDPGNSGGLPPELQ